MSIEYRQVTADEFPNWRTLVRRGFGDSVHPEDIARLRDDRAELDRLFGAFDGDQIVGTGGADSHLMTVPGGNQVATAGVAYIGTAATHRRRGVLTGMIKSIVDQASDRQEPLAALWASESGIYSRFGFGQATIAEAWEIETHRASFSNLPEIRGRVRFAEPEEALKKMPQVWAKTGSMRAGSLDRSERRWRYNFFDAKRVRDGWSGLFFVLYEVDGSVRGYAVYRLMPVEPDDDPLKMQVVECIAQTDDAHAALWRFLLSIDLVDSVLADNRPPDDQLWWTLADPRRLNRAPTDGLWVRVIDTEKALSARSYAAEGRLVIAIEDSFIPESGGVFSLEASGGVATCTRTTEMPDISISSSEIGATYLGGVRLVDLAKAGRATEHKSGSIRLFDRMFLADRAPWCAHHF